jgi:hypothetical protein
LIGTKLVINVISANFYTFLPSKKIIYKKYLYILCKTKKYAYLCGVKE